MEPPANREIRQMPVDKEVVVCVWSATPFRTPVRTASVSVAPLVRLAHLAQFAAAVCVCLCVIQPAVPVAAALAMAHARIRVHLLQAAEVVIVLLTLVVQCTVQQGLLDSPAQQTATVRITTFAQS
jgi:hypothetical protein